VGVIFGVSGGFNRHQWFYPGFAIPLEEPAWLIDYRRFLIIPEKRNLSRVFKTSATAWGFQNPHYFLGFSKPPLLLGVFITPIIAGDYKTPISVWGYKTPITPSPIFFVQLRKLDWSKSISSKLKCNQIYFYNKKWINK